ncbi:MAG: glycosyltransferase family 2 protein [Desulfarculus sp.]|nr:glycosyltransferase family 2 protein [Desulfarculus sp.]
MPPKLYVILPVYNEGQSIHGLLAVYARLLPGLSLGHQVLVIDDHSQDDSPYWIDRAAREFEALNLTCLRHPANQGLHGVLNTGLGLLAGVLRPQDLLVTMDGDNTHNPHLIKEMLAKVEQGADVVIASRYCEASRISGLSRARVVLSWGAGLLYRLRWRIPGVKDYTCLFRLYRGEAVLPLLREGGPVYLREQGFTCSSELLRRLAAPGLVCVEVPMILRYANKLGASNMKVLGTVMKTLRMLARGGA